MNATIWLLPLAALLGLFVGYFAQKLTTARTLGDAEARAQRILEDAKRLVDQAARDSEAKIREGEAKVREAEARILSIHGGGITTRAPLGPRPFAVRFLEAR